MLDKAISLIAPHLCYICESKGGLLCRSCIYDITNDRNEQCVHCSALSSNGICRSCRSKESFSRAWIVGDRKDELKFIINKLKFERTYQAAETCAELLHNTLPLLPSDTIVVPIPTISAHIRIRGYDHTLMIAKRLAVKRNLQHKSLLKRRNNYVQVGATLTKRKLQAKEAFYSSDSVSSRIPYLIIDDIITTGSTISSASRILKEQGAQNIWIAAIARQPL